MTAQSILKTAAAVAIAAASVTSMAQADGVGFVPELEADYDLKPRAEVSQSVVSSNASPAELDNFPQNRGDDSFVNASNGKRFLIDFGNLRNIDIF